MGAIPQLIDFTSRLPVADCGSAATEHAEDAEDTGDPRHGVVGRLADLLVGDDAVPVTVDGADIAATYGETYYAANGRCFYAPDGVYALDGEVVLPLADLEKIFGVKVTDAIPERTAIQQA